MLEAAYRFCQLFTTERLLHLISLPDTLTESMGNDLPADFPCRHFAREGFANMATFYLLPPRPLLGQRFAAYLHNLFPGMEFGVPEWPELAETLGAAASRQPEVYVVYREELADDGDPSLSLMEGFGAEAGDEVVEVRPGPRPEELTSQRWRLE